MKNEAVIFDMDGVIFDSERATYNIWLEIGEKYGIKDIEIPYRKTIGTNNERTRQIFLEYYGENSPYDSYKAEASAEYHRRYDGGRLPIMRGVKELLSYLKENGVKTAIASSTRTALVKQQVIDAGLYEYFDKLIGGDMVTRSKPEPDIFLKAASELGVAEENCFVIEDSFNGIRAAKQAGMKPIMVPDMMEADDEMYKKSVAVLNDLLEVIEYIEKCGV